MSYETNDKMVSHPDHYKSGKYEVIDIIDEFTKDLEGTEAVCTANAIKYILRWKKKNGVQDVKKAIWYLTHLVDHLENKERAELLTKQLRRNIENSTYGLAVGIDDDPGPIKCIRSSSGVYIPEPRNTVYNTCDIEHREMGTREKIFATPEDCMPLKIDKLEKENARLQKTVNAISEENIIIKEQLEHLDTEYEETVRGELMNLRSVKRHLEDVESNHDFDADLERAFQIVRSDITNFEKFVDERWPNKEESECSD